MIETIPINGVGQVRADDVLLIKLGNGRIAPVTVKEVLFRGKPDEEIIISKSRNLYFIVSKYLDGTSWVKDCVKLVNGRIYSVSNTQRDINRTEEHHPLAS